MTSDPWRRRTSLCLQAEMDMITTDELGSKEDKKMEDQILMLFYSQAVCVSTYFWFCHASLYCLYTYSCNDSTLQVLGTSTVIYAMRAQ